VRLELQRGTDIDVEDESRTIEKVTLLAYSCYYFAVPYSLPQSGRQQDEVVVVLGNPDQDLRSPIFLVFLRDKKADVGSQQQAR
jgi:hypothetical protein